MTRLLLDFPWTLDEDLNAASNAWGVFRAFVNLLLDIGLEGVPFIHPEEYVAAMQRLRHGNSAAHIYRFGKQFLREPSEATPTATPEVAGAKGSPSQFTDGWQQALRAELGDCNNWRNPQIVFAQSRGAIWPKTREVAIRLSDRATMESRVLAQLESYMAHPLATADIDPWRACEWINQPPARNRVDHPCRLPKPPDLIGVAPEQLTERLVDVRQQGWNIRQKFHFIPPQDWAPEAVPQARWRGGRAFPWQSTDHGSGPVDYLNQVWVWHRTSAGNVGERHWDVQKSDGGHQRISHDGRDLDG